MDRMDSASATAVQDAIAGTRTLGTVTGATPTGVFVSFFNGIRGLVHASALGLAEDQAPDDAFRVGQVQCAQLCCMRSRSTLRGNGLHLCARQDAFRVGQVWCPTSFADRLWTTYGSGSVVSVRGFCVCQSDVCASISLWPLF